MSKYCVDSTGCTTGLLVDNNNSNISNGIWTWWLVCYLEQNLKPPRIQASRVSSWLVELVFWASSEFEVSHLKCSIPEMCALVLLITISSLYTKRWICFRLRLDWSSAQVCLTLFFATILIIAHLLQNTYVKPSLLTIFGVLLKVWFNNR